MPGEDEAKIEEQAFQRMAPVISHELRNPLAIIGNSAYFIRSKLSSLGKTDPKVEKHLGIIEDEVKRANATLGEILAFTRMREPAKSPCSLNGIIDKALSGFPPRRLKPLLEPAPSDHTVCVDEELIIQCLGHLIRNADESGAEGEVRIRARFEKGWARIEVMDSGPGLPSDARLFIPFCTTKPRGIGLGLSFVRKAVERHGGKITVADRPGKGVAARLELPAR
ncbi:MAG: HAMP domain-containing sensor histidine kinase [Elusimicrobiota bacterium]|jgi:signal transduction histidine kinase